MFASQIVGALLGVVLAPLAFLLFYATGQVGAPHGPYPTPFADIYRAMAILGTQGFGALPRYCAAITGALFLCSAAMCALRDALPKTWARFVPSPMAMGTVFYIGAATAIDFWLGSVVMHVVSGG